MFPTDMDTPEMVGSDVHVPPTEKFEAIKSVVASLKVAVTEGGREFT